MAIVRVAPYGSTEEAEYRCTGENDQLTVNQAIRFVSEAYGGGTVQLLEGTFNKSDYYDILSNVKLEGSGPGTINTETGTAISVSCVGTAALHRTGCSLSNMKFSNPHQILFNYSDSCLIQNIKCIGSFTAHGSTLIGVSNSDSVIITNIEVDGQQLTSDCTAIIESVSNTNVLITNNIIQGFYSGGFTYGIIIASDSTIQIMGNSIYDLSTSHGLSYSMGITGVFNYGLISNNRISNIKNTATAANVWAIRINTTSTSDLICDNYCYNNGSDTGIANTNGCQFSDVGTLTQTWGNSWQQTLILQPALATGAVGFGASNTGGGYYFGGESSAGAAWFTGTSAYACVVGTSGPYSLQLVTNNAVRVTVLSGGNVGIGTTSPLSSLQVAGAIDTTPNTAGAHLGVAGNYGAME